MASILSRPQCVNPLRPSDAYTCEQTLTYNSQLDRREQIPIKFPSKYKHFHSRKYIQNVICKMVAILIRPRYVLTREIKHDSSWLKTLARISLGHIQWKLKSNTYCEPVILHEVAQGCNSLRWRPNGHDSVSNHQPPHCLLNRLFGCRSKKTSCKAPRHWPLCGEFTGTGGFPAQMASNTENVSIWWSCDWIFWTLRWCDYTSKYSLQYAVFLYFTQKQRCGKCNWGNVSSVGIVSSIPNAAETSTRSVPNGYALFTGDFLITILSRRPFLRFSTISFSMSSVKFQEMYNFDPNWAFCFGV